MLSIMSKQRPENHEMLLNFTGLQMKEPHGQPVVDRSVGIRLPDPSTPSPCPPRDQDQAAAPQVSIPRLRCDATNYMYKVLGQHDTKNCQEKMKKVRFLYFEKYIVIPRENEGI